MFHARGRSDVGRVRRTNEDSYAIVSPLGLFVVADGMGGHNAGEVASRLAVDAIVGFVQRTFDTEEVTWPFGIDTTLSYDGNRLKTALQVANRRVFRAAESRDEYMGMGTTAVGALLSPGQLAVAHVGDSRLYVLKNSNLTPVTRDDTWVARVLAVDPASTAGLNHPMRHVLTNVLGASDQVEVHVQEVPLAGGETVLLCTDGLHGVVSDAEIAELLDGDGDLEAKAEQLIDAALARGSRDNISVVIVREEGNGR